MKHLRRPGLLHCVAVLTFLFLSAAVNAQVQTARAGVSMTGNSGGYYEYLPQGYSTNTWQSYPVIVFIHGIGELGNGATDLGNILNAWTSLPRLIANGAFPASFTVSGQSSNFIVISPQFRNWPSASDVNDVVNFVTKNYRVDQSRIYVTGLSMGGGATWDFAAAYPTKVSAIVPIAGASNPDDTRAQAIANAKLAVWATHNQNDPTVSSSNTTGWVSKINQYGGNAQMTIFNASGHDAWSQTYDPNFTQNGVNIYQWMLQHQKGSSTPPANQPPTANAGYGQTITLPVNAITLSGSGSDADGYIASYSWSQVSGPSQANIASAASASTPVYSLSQGTYVFRLTVTDNAGAKTTSDVTTTVNAAINTSFTSGSTTRIEAENWSNVSAGPQTENTLDAGGGKDVGWIDNGDWMDYTVSASSAGTYAINLRLACPYTGAQLQIKNSAGTVLATVNVPFTAGYQTWQTISTNISLAAGSQTIRVQSTSNAGFNFNWMEIAGSGTASSGGGGGGGSTSGSTTRIEAENWSNMSGVQTENTLDAGGGKDVGWIDNGDWMDYTVSASSAGTYAINLRLACPYTGAQLQIKNSAGTVLATVNVPFTAGYQTWQTISTNISLAAGSQTIRVQSTSNAGFNFNWMEIAGSGTASSGGGGGGSTSGSTTRIEAENWSNMSGVQTENTLDAGGGKDVGWIDNGDWMDYTISASSAGTYAINLRLACPYTGAQLQIKNSAGTVLATVNVPLTGGYQTWQTISTNISLAAGSQTIRVQSTSNAGFNFNWMELAGSGIAAGITASAQTTATTLASAASAMAVYPNPVVNSFQLQIDNNVTGSITVQVIDMQGAVQKQFSLTKADTGSSQYYLSIGELPAANYVLKASMNGWTNSTQIVKQ